MHKAKTHKGLSKRVKVTAKKKIKFRPPFSGHLMSGKTGNRKRDLRKARVLNDTMAKRMVAALNAF